MKKRLLNIVDWNLIAENFTAIQTYMNNSATAIGDLQTRMVSAESSTGWQTNAIGSLMNRN